MPDELTADRIRAYLAGTGWTLGPIGAGAALWQRHGGSIRLPHEMTDWDLGKAVMDIGIAEDRHPGDVHADVLAYDGPAVGGPVQTQPLLEGGCVFPMPSREHLEQMAGRVEVRLRRRTPDEARAWLLEHRDKYIAQGIPAEILDRMIDDTYDQEQP